MFFCNLSSWLFGDADFFRIEHDAFLYLLVLLVLFLGVLYLYDKQRKRKLSKALNPLAFERIFPAWNRQRNLFKLLLWFLAMFFLVLGISNPQFGNKKEEVLQKGVDLVFALDVSKSMLAEDIKPNRIERAKHAMSKAIDRLGSDRVAIVVFAGDAFLQLPLTNDHGAAKMYLSEINVGMIPLGGTSISSALKKSLSALPEKKEGAAIVLITDGEDQDEEAESLAEECANEGVKVYALGLGTQRGATIPEYVNGRKVGLKKDAKGSTVVTKINESLLRSVATKSNGIYIRASNENLGLSELFNEIKQMDKTEFGQKKFTSYENRFMYFIWLSLGLFLLNFLLFSNKKRGVIKQNKEV